MTTETVQPVAAKGGDFLIEDRTPGEVFTPEMLRGGYRKKYYRALSRLTALAG